VLPAGEAEVEAEEEVGAAYIVGAVVGNR